MALPITCRQHAREKTIAIAVSSDSLFSSEKFVTRRGGAIQSAINCRLIALAIAWRRPITPSLRALLFR